MLEKLYLGGSLVVQWSVDSMGPKGVMDFITHILIQMDHEVVELGKYIVFFLFIINLSNLFNR